jgi:hypothetical protein
VTVDAIFTAWKLWCDDNNRRPGSKQQFGKMLNAAQPGIRRVQPREDDSRYRAYQGIRLNDTWTKLLERLSDESSAEVSADRVPPRAEAPHESNAQPPEEPPERGGTRENLTRLKLRPVGDTPPDEPAESDADQSFWADQEQGDWSA